MRNTLFSFFQSRPFLRNAGVLTVGTVFAQGITVLILPVLTRLYSPEVFGLLSVYVALIGIATVVSCLRLELAIPVPERDEDAASLLALAFIAATVLSTVLAIVVMALPEQIFASLRQPMIQPYLWLIPVGVFFASTYSALQYWSSRHKRFVLITRTRLSRTLGASSAQLVFGLASGSPFGMLFGHLLYSGLGVFGLAGKLWRSDRALLGTVSLRSMRAMLIAYSRFPTRLVPAAVLDAGHQHLPILIMAPVIGGAEIGMAFLVIRALAMPISLVGTSISQVYLADAGARLDSGDLGSFTRLIMRNIFSIGTPLMIAIGAIGYFFWGWIFGEEYAPAGTMALWMTPWFIAHLVSSPVSIIFAATNRQSEWLTLQAFGFLIIVGGTVAATWYLPAYTIIVFSLANFVFYSVVSAAVIYLTYHIERRG